MPMSLCVRRHAFTAAVVSVAAGTMIPTLAGAQIAPTFVDSVQRSKDPRYSTPPSINPRYTVALYGWMLGIHGQMGVRDLSADVDISFKDLLDHLRFAGMGAFEVDYGPWLGTVDLVYASVGANRELALRRGDPDLDATVKTFIGQAFAGYSFPLAPRVAIDLLAGARVWAFDASLSVSGDRTSVTRSRSPSWVDALGGFRVRATPADRWSLSLVADGGGGGSRGTGEGAATVGYALSRHWAAYGAYRYLYVDKTKNDFFFNGHLSGPVIGGTYRW